MSLTNSLRSRQRVESKPQQWRAENVAKDSQSCEARTGWSAFSAQVASMRLCMGGRPRCWPEGWEWGLGLPLRCWIKFLYIKKSAHDFTSYFMMLGDIVVTLLNFVLHSSLSLKYFQTFLPVCFVIHQENKLWNLNLLLFRDTGNRKQWETGSIYKWIWSYYFSFIASSGRSKRVVV